LLASGYFELLGAGDLLLKSTGRAGGSRQYVLTIAVNPVHIRAETYRRRIVT
jgi:uncharacterized membrane protein